MTPEVTLSTPQQRQNVNQVSVSYSSLALMPLNHPAPVMAEILPAGGGPGGPTKGSEIEKGLVIKTSTLSHSLRDNRTCGLAEVILS